MTKVSIAGLVLAGFLAGCGGTSSTKSVSPEEKAARAKTDAVWSTRESVTYKGNPFEIAVNPERTVAHVQASKTDFSYTPKDVELIARNKTGCRGEFQSGVLAFIGGFDGNSDLKIVKGKNKKPFRWSVSLSC